MAQGCFVFIYFLLCPQMGHGLVRYFPYSDKLCLEVYDNDKWKIEESIYRYTPFKGYTGVLKVEKEIGFGCFINTHEIRDENLTGNNIF